MLKKFISKRVILLTIILAFFILLVPIDAVPLSDKAPEAKRYVLDNGLIIILKEMHTAPVVALQVWVNAGGITEDEYLGCGISHFVEHMLFKGTKKRKVGQIAQEIRAAGGEIGGYTSFEHTVYHITIPNKQFDIALDVLSDAVMNSSFDAQEIERERQVILKEINMNDDDPDKYITRKLWKTAYLTHPYHHPIIGYQSLFENLTRDDLIKYYKKNYVPNNIVISIAGDFDSTVVLNKVKEAFEGLKDFKQQPLPYVYIPDEPKQLGLRREIEEYEVEIASLQMGFHTIDIRSEDVYPLDLLAIILGQGKSSRLYKGVKESKQLVYSINSWSYTPNKPGLFGITSTLEPKNLRDAEQSILEELNRVKTELISDEELALAKKMVISQYVFEQETIEKQAANLALNELTTGNINFSDLYVQKASQVTKEQIKIVANKYLRNDNLTIVALIPKFEAITTASPLSIPCPEVTKTILDNGLTILIRENHNLPIVTIQAVFKGGPCFEPEGKNGLCNFTQLMLLKGTKNRTRDAIAFEIESRGGEISTYGGNNSFGCSISMLNDDINLGLEILSDVIINSTFPDDEIEKERDLILANIRSQEDDIFQAGLKTLKSILWQKHPYRFQTIGDKDSISNITKDDIVTFYQTYCTPNNMVLFVSGDVNTEKVKERIKHLFGDAIQRKPLTINIPLEPEQTEVRRVTLEKEKKQALILVGFHGIDLFNPDRYALEVMNAILSGQNSRLFNNLREKQGLAYYVGAFSILGLDPGAYIMYLGTTPEKIEIGLTSLFEEIKKIKTDLVSVEELKMAQNNLIGSKAIDLQTNSSYSFESALDELYGLGYDNLTKYEQKINQISPEEIRDVANKYLNTETCSIVVLSPKEKK